MRVRGKPPADAIHSADWHLREDQPPCRTDSYWEAQQTKVRAIADLQRKNNSCPVLIAGDIFHHWKASPFLLQWAITELSAFTGPIIVVPGQHDLPHHSLEQYNRSGLAVLETAGVVRVLGECDWNDWSPSGIGMEIHGFPWGAELGPPKEGHLALKRARIALVHKLVYTGKPPFPGAEKSGATAKALLEQMDGFNLIVTGDHHKSFVYEGEGLERLLVNPGSLGRQRSDQADHQPSVYLWWAKENRVQRHFLPYNEGVVSRSHLVEAEERNERLDVFVQRLQDDYDVTLSFEQNVEAYLKANDIRPAVCELVWELLEKEKK